MGHTKKKLSACRDRCVLLFLAKGGDAALAHAVLSEAGFETEVSGDVEALCQGIVSGAGAVLAAEEALTPPALNRLTRALQRQPPWSDLPLIILTAGVGSGGASRRNLDTLGSATFLERPLRVATLLQAVKVALKSRTRQYDIREHLRERERAAQERLALLETQRAFLRDVLLSVTEGKLRLCDSEADLPARLPSVSEPVPLTDRSLRLLRRTAMEAMEARHFPVERAHDFVTAVGEASMNAVVHAGGGSGWVGGGIVPDGSAEDKVQAWIEDRGKGIDMAHLPRATLERGFSSAGTLGHGFWMLLKTCDRVYLLTGPLGTTVVLEQDREAPQPGWMV